MATNWTPSQLQAIHLHGCDLLISAAAGSGKTATLTERIIRSLTGSIPDGNGGYLPPADISRMLIVTFTRAAAAELRARISAALSAAIAAQPDNRHLYRQLLALGSADICTIDSFYLQPVRANFERLGLPSSFRLADESELAPLKSDTMQRLLDAAYTRYVPADATPEQPLSVLQDNAFARVMDDILPNRDRGESADILLRLYEKLQSYPEGISLLQSRAKRLEEQAALPFLQGDVGALLRDHLCARLASLAHRITLACRVFAQDEAARQLYLEAAQHDLDTVTQASLLLQQGNWDGAGQLLCAFEPLRLKSSRKVTAGPEALECKERRADWVDQIRDLALYFEDDDATRRAHLSHSAVCEQMLCELLMEYDREISAVKLRRGVQDFTDIRRALLTLLFAPDGTPTDIALSLRERYDAVYIDEYQDVDAVQDAIFATVGTDGKRFMVGDIKQSIYAFRGAEPSIFAAYRQRFAPASPDAPLPEHASGLCLFMSENFRCNQPVIDFTNAVCGYAFSACGASIGYQRATDDLICGKRTASTPTPVQMVLLETLRDGEGKGNPPSPSDKINPEAVYIAGEIHRLLCGECLDDGTPIRPHHIAVLMRSTEKAADLHEALAAYGIETTHKASASLASHPDMIALINLLSVIDNPRDDVPLTALLSEPDAPLTLQDLLTLRAADPICKEIPVYDVLCMAAQGAEPLSAVAPALQQSCARLVDFIRRWQAVARTLPADKLLRKLYGEPALQHKATTPVYLAVYDRARHDQNNAFCGLYQFLQSFRRLLEQPDALSHAAASADGQDAVTLLSIHKSKGLEFPVVFLAGCAAPFNTKDTTAPITFDASLGAAARIYEMQAGNRRESVLRLAIAEQLRLRQTEEEIRILYVALTRARERLYVTAALRGSAASAISRATAFGTQGDRVATLDTNNYLGWMLAALFPTSSTTPPTHYALHVLDRRNYTRDALPQTPPHTVQKKQADESAVGSAAFYRNVLKEHQLFHDPNALLRTLPTKAAASKLRYDLLDHGFLPEAIAPEQDEPLPPPAPDEREWQESDYIRHRIALLRTARKPFSDLLHAKRQADAAERGTATHLFLQYCDHAALARHGVEEEIARLVRERYLTERTAAMLNRHHLHAFVKSALFARILAAKTVYRELQFNRFLPYRTLTARAELADALGDASLYVQGSLDLLLVEADGTLTLCDYKTDRLRTEDFTASLPAQARESALRERLLADHGDQLRIYADAVADMLGRRPDRTVIYSLPLGKEVELQALL